MMRTTFKLLLTGLVCAGVAVGGLSLLVQPAEGKQSPPSLAKTLRRAQQAKGWFTRQTLTCNSPVTAVAVGPDFIVTGHENGSLIIWDAKTGKEKHVPIDGATRDAKRVDQIQISSDAAWLYSVNAERRGICKCPVAKENREFFGVGASGMKWFGFHSDGNWLGYNEQNALVQIEDPFTETGFGQLKLFHIHNDPIDLVGAGDDNTIITIAGGVLRRWKSEGQTWEEKLDKFEPTQLIIGPGGKTIAVAGKGGEVKILSAETGKVISKLSGHTGSVHVVAFSRDGKQVVTGGEDKTARVWDSESGKQIAKLGGHTDAVAGVAFGPGGETIVTGSADKTVRIWELKK
jgi:WD40 repeat protein